MTTLTFYNGLREIGGTFVVVETDEARCMFDFGFVTPAEIAISIAAELIAVRAKREGREKSRYRKP